MHAILLEAAPIAILELSKKQLLGPQGHSTVEASYLLGGHLSCLHLPFSSHPFHTCS